MALFSRVSSLCAALALTLGASTAAIAQATAPAAQPAARPAGSGGVLNVLNWADYIGPDVIANFERETGIRVRYDATIESNETLHARLVAGRTGYDIVVPSAHFAALQIQGNLFQPLNPALIPNLRNLDPVLQSKLATVDPGNRHLVTWMWGYVTVGINEQKVRAALGDLPMPVNPLSLIFNPRYATRLRGCGIHVLDSASDVVPVAMLYAGMDGFSNNARDYEAAREVLMRARPFITRFFSPGPINDLAQGQLCVSLGYSGDFIIANQRAREAGKTWTIRPLIPPRGATMFIDTMAIPRDAANVENAHRFIDFILRPEVHASLTNTVFFGNPNVPARQFVRPDLARDPMIFPTEADMRKLTVPRVISAEARRAQTRVFQAFRAGR